MYTYYSIAGVARRWFEGVLPGLARLHPWAIRESPRGRWSDGAKRRRCRTRPQAGPFPGRESAQPTAGPPGIRISSV